MSFFRSLFGPSRDEVWREFADQVNGEFLQTKQFLSSKSLVRIPRDNWTITLDSYSKDTNSKEGGSRHFTRIRAPFRNTSDFRFSIYRTHLFSGIGKALGFQDVEVGDSVFDSAFVIKSNNEDRVRQLFAADELKRQIMALKIVNLCIEEDTGFFGSMLPEGVDQLLFTREGTIKDLPELHTIIEIFEVCLQQLVKIGAATSENPEFYY